MGRRPPLAALVAAAVDPAFVGTPFQPGQTGVAWRGVANPTQPTWPSGPACVIWCGPYVEIQQRYPRLPQAHGQDDQIDIACIDLTLEFDAGGVLTRSDLEAHTLAQTLLLVGMEDEAQTASGLFGLPARQVCTALPPVITALWERVSA